MARRNPLRRFWGFLLTAGEHDGESRDQRGRRRIVVGILWVSVVGLFGGIDWETGGPVGALDALKAAGHFGALLLLWWLPRHITPIIFAMVGVDLVVDVVQTALYGGVYESGLQIMWSSISVVALLVVTTVRAAVIFLGLFLTALVGVLVLPPVDPPVAFLVDPAAEAVFVLATSMLFTLLGMFYFVRQRDRFLAESEDLLHNILPDEIATRLKLGEGLIAGHFDDVTVLFVDVVDFTPLSADLAPAQLVGLLNDIFTGFDALVDELGLEKIKTVGDEYMVASGIPVPRTDHAEAAAELALRMQEHLGARRYAGRRISVRMGMNSGPVVAGIIGRRKFSYDLWGDVVNTASRMESHGVAGEIQVSRSTLEHLRDRFVFERRGPIAVTGKGTQETWFLRGRAPGEGSEAQGINVSPS